MNSFDYIQVDEFVPEDFDNLDAFWGEEDYEQ